MEKLCTREDYRAMPEDWRGELIEGELVMAPAPAPYHQHLQKRLLRRLGNHFGDAQDWRVLGAPLDVEIDLHNVFQPDIVVLPEDAAPPRSMDWTVPLPIWVIEILSPGTAMIDRHKKLPKMAGAGVREAWLVSPQRAEIEVFDLETGKHSVHSRNEVIRSLTVPGFELALDRYFVA